MTDRLLYSMPPPTAGYGHPSEKLWMATDGVVNWARAKLGLVEFSIPANHIVCPTQYYGSNACGGYTAANLAFLLDRVAKGEKLTTEGKSTSPGTKFYSIA
jgi:hypothetical protein